MNDDKLEQAISAAIKSAEAAERATAKRHLYGNSSPKRIGPQSPYPSVLSPPSSLPNFLSLQGLTSSTGSPMPSPTGAGAGGSGGGASEWDEDFVMLCEFSEHYGAVEIWHVPESAGLAGFDKSKFLSSVMSVDYQSRHEAGDTFQGDTSVSVVDPNSRHTYYAHHFTLLDIQARGYVRPLVFVYVTRSTTLVMTHHKELSGLFSEMAKVLKHYNWALTRRDLEHRIADLRYTLAELKSGDEERVRECLNSSDSSMDCAQNGFSQSMVTGLGDRLRDLTRLQAKLVGVEQGLGPPAVPEEYLHSLEDVDLLDDIPYIPAPCINEHKRRFDKCLRTVEELCGESPVTFVKYVALRMIARFFQSPPAIAEREISAASVDLVFPKELELHIGGPTVRINYAAAGKKAGSPTAPKSCTKACFCSRPAHDPLPPAHLQTGGKEGRESACEEKDKDKDFKKCSESSVRSPLLISQKPLNEEEEAEEEEEKEEEEEEEKARDTNVNKKGHSKEAPLGGSAGYPPLVVGAYNMDEDTSRFWFYEETVPGGGGGGGGARPGLHEFIAGRSFSRALVYSLLRGRPVVVRARPEKRPLVEHYVKLLSTFVAAAPGCRNESSGGNSGVELWRETPLRMADFATLRLVGVPRKQLILPRAVERCVTLFNADTAPESLLAPECPPDAEYVTQLLALDKCWPDEDSYYAHVREALYNMAVWSSLYYHMCCVGTLNFLPEADKTESGKEKEKEKAALSGEERTAAIEAALEKAAVAEAPPQKTVFTTTPLSLDVRGAFRTQFCAGAKISRSDLAILENFAEVVKLRQVTAEPGAHLHVLPVRVDHAHAQLFKNTYK